MKNLISNELQLFFQKTKKNFSFKKINCLHIKQNQQMVLEGDLEIVGELILDGEIFFISHEKNSCNKIENQNYLMSPFIFSQLNLSGILYVNCESQIFCDYRNFPKKRVSDYFLLKNGDYNLVNSNFEIDGVFENYGELEII